ncbi:hypothetical protein V3C33_07470 [Micrococcaceae bacterium Sec5.7]
MREIIRWADSTAVRRELMWTGREIGHRIVQYGPRGTREAFADWDQDGHRDVQQASLTIRRPPSRADNMTPRSPEAMPRLGLDRFMSVEISVRHAEPLRPARATPVLC